MIEFLQFAFTPAVAVFSMLLCVVLLYWLVVIVGLLDTDFLNVDAGGDVGDVGGDVGDVGGHDMDLGHDVDSGDLAGDHAFGHDAGHDAGHDGHIASAVGPFHAMMSFFYLGRIPVTVLVTLLVSSMWFIVMLANHAVNPSGGLLLGLPIAVGAVVVSLFVVKIAGWPFARLYQAMNATRGEMRSVIGKMCVLITSVAPGRTGQAQVKTIGAPAVVNVTCEDGVSLDRGSEAVILEFRKASNVYVVAPVDLDEMNAQGPGNRENK